MEVNLREADITAIFNKGIQAHNAGDLNAAERLYHETLIMQPNHSEANHNTGAVLVAKNEFEQALKFFKFALDTSPNVSLFWASYIDTLIKLERITESKTLIKAVKDANITCDKIEAISLQLNADYQEPKAQDCEKIDELITEQEFDVAVKACLSLMETYPSSAILNINLGKCYFRLGKIESAICCYKKATKYQPEWTLSYTMLSQLYSSQKKPCQAIKSLKKALTLTPDNHELNSALGRELFQNGDVDEAIKYLEKALVQDPSSVSILVMLGDTSKINNNYKLAIGYYKQAVQLEPNDEKSYFNMANALFADGDFDGAIEKYHQAISIKPDFIGAYINLGISQKEKEDFDTAIKNFKKALKIDPECADAYYNMGNALYGDGHYEAAIDSFAQAIKINTNYPEANMSMGEVHLTLKNYESAKACFDQCSDQYAIAKSLECLFFMKNFKKFENVLDTLVITDPTNIRVAAISAFAAHQRDKKDIYPFCGDPLKLIQFSNLKSHVPYPKRYIANILDEMNKKDMSWQPQNKTTKVGFHTTGNIFDRSNNTIASLEKIILKELDLYFEKFQSSNSVLFNRWPQEKILNGWFVRMFKNGHQSSHIHVSGWVSGVLYLKTVKSPSKNEGAIEFSLQGYNYPIARDDYPKKLYQPIDGEIVLFPSSLFHRTIPVIKDVERSVIAFDLQPG